MSLSNDLENMVIKAASLRKQAGLLDKVIRGAGKVKGLAGKVTRKVRDITPEDLLSANLPDKVKGLGGKVQDVIPEDLLGKVKDVIPDKLLEVPAKVKGLLDRSRRGFEPLKSRSMTPEELLIATTPPSIKGLGADAAEEVIRQNDMLSELRKALYEGADKVTGNAPITGLLGAGAGAGAYGLSTLPSYLTSLRDLKEGKFGTSGEFTDAIRPRGSKPLMTAMGLGGGVGLGSAVGWGMGLHRLTKAKKLMKLFSLSINPANRRELGSHMLGQAGPSALKGGLIGGGIGGVGGAGVGAVQDEFAKTLAARFSPRSNKYVPNSDNSWFHNYFPNK